MFLGKPPPVDPALVETLPIPDSSFNGKEEQGPPASTSTSSSSSSSGGGVREAEWQRVLQMGALCDPTDPLTHFPTQFRSLAELCGGNYTCPLLLQCVQIVSPKRPLPGGGGGALGGAGGGGGGGKSPIMPKVCLEYSFTLASLLRWQQRDPGGFFWRDGPSGVGGKGRRVGVRVRVLSSRAEAADDARLLACTRAAMLDCYRHAHLSVRMETTGVLKLREANLAVNRLILRVSRWRERASTRAVASSTSRSSSTSTYKGSLKAPPAAPADGGANDQVVVFLICCLSLTQKKNQRTPIQSLTQTYVVLSVRFSVSFVSGLQPKRMG